MKIMTRGDNYNCECPHCGKINHYITRGYKLPPLNVVAKLTTTCSFCKKPIDYSIEWEIKVIAEPGVEERNNG